MESKPKIAIITIVYNEAHIMPYFIAHYKALGDIFVYNDGSTDNTAQICKDAGCKVISFDSCMYDLKVVTDFQNSLAKKYRYYDYIVIVDADEFLYHANLKNVIKEAFNSGATIFKTQGFEMFSESEPEPGIPITESIKNGIPKTSFNKLVIFSPKDININYRFGRHSAAPTGYIKNNGETIYLLHYKYIGSLNRLQTKHKEYFTYISNSDYNFQNTLCLWNYLKNHSKPIL
jgi:glycosyltransferase involved in cell wall biosynthesis